MFVIYDCLGTIKGTNLENYNARIQNERKILTFKGLKTKEQAKEYSIKYLNYAENEIIIK